VSTSSYVELSSRSPFVSLKILMSMVQLLYNSGWDSCQYKSW